MFLSKLRYSELVQRLFEKMTFFLVDPLSPPTIPHPLCCPCALVVWRPVIIIACHRVIIVAIFVDCHHAFAAPVNDWLLFVVLPSLCPHCCPPPPVYLCVLNRVPT